MNQDQKDIYNAERSGSDEIYTRQLSKGITALTL